MQMDKQAFAKHKPFSKKLIAATATALKLCTPSNNQSMSHVELHVFNKRATPSQIMIYKHAHLLYKILMEKHLP